MQRVLKERFGATLDIYPVTSVIDLDAWFRSTPKYKPAAASKPLQERDFARSHYEGREREPIREWAKNDTFTLIESFGGGH